MAVMGTTRALAALHSVGDSDSTPAVLAGLVSRVAKARGVAVDLVVNHKVVTPSRAVADAGFDDDWLAEHGARFVGTAREALLLADDRKGLAAHHTSQEVAASVVDLAFSACEATPRRILDPSAGGGAFVLAIADRLRADGLTDRAVIDAIVAVDIDPLAVGVARAALSLWTTDADVSGAGFHQADFLNVAAGQFGSFELVVGNPPFRSQLRRGLTRDSAEQASVRKRWPEAGAYTDDASLFMLAALDQVDSDGVVALLQPTSVMASRDSKGLRRRVHSWGGLWGLWVDTGRVFDAQVDTCAVVVASGSQSQLVQRRGGPGGDRLPDYECLVTPASWAPLLADLSGVPAVTIVGHESEATLKDVASCTAGFRDQFYGLRAAVDDLGEDLGGELDQHTGRLITSGLIDPLREHWGVRTCRFDGVTRQRPVVRSDRIGEKVQGWFALRRVPKVLVATQTRVIEAIVDPVGNRVPVTPLISVEPTGIDITIWHLGAVLVSPVASAILARNMAGSALSAGAIRVTATAIGDIPLPSSRQYWDEAAALVRSLTESPAANIDVHQEAMGELGEIMAAAHGVADPAVLLQWWLDRQPANW